MKDVKLNERIIEQFHKILSDELNVLYLTEEELCFLVNDWLQEEDKFSYSTFQNRKKNAIEENSKKKEIDNKNADAYNRQMYKKIFECFEKAKIKTKKILFNPLIKWEINWQSKAWIIERKFSDWNLKHISENKNINENYNISDEEQKLLNTVLWENTI